MVDLSAWVYDNVPVIHTELANCPDWLSLSVMVNGENFRLDRGDILGVADLEDEEISPSTGKSF